MNKLHLIERMRSRAQENGLSLDQVDLLAAIEQAVEDGRWGAVGAYIGEISRQAGQIQIRSGDWINAYLREMRRRLQEHLDLYAIQWPELTKTQVAVLNSIDLYEERGDWNAVSYFAGHLTFKAMSNSATPSLIQHLESIRKKVIDVNNQGNVNSNLLRLKHPAQLFAQEHRARVENINRLRFQHMTV